MQTLIPLLHLAGLRAIPVADLGRAAWLISDASIVLIDSGLCSADLAQIAAQILAQAVDQAL